MTENHQNRGSGGLRQGLLFIWELCERDLQVQRCAVDIFKKELLREEIIEPTQLSDLDLWPVRYNSTHASVQIPGNSFDQPPSRYSTIHGEEILD